jgi:hypothetical protein
VKQPESPGKFQNLMMNITSRFAKLGYALIVFSLISLGLSGVTLGAIKSSNEQSLPSMQQHMSMMKMMDMGGMVAGDCEDCAGMMSRSSVHCSLQATVLPLPEMGFPSHLVRRDPLPREQLPYARSFTPEPPPPRL